MRKGIGTIQEPKHPKGMSPEVAERVKQGFMAKEAEHNANIARAKLALSRFGCRIEYQANNGYYISGIVSTLPRKTKEQYIWKASQLNGHPAETYGVGHYISRHGELQIHFLYWKDLEPFICALEGVKK